MSDYIPIHTFDEIPPFIRGVQERIYSLLIWESRGGLGKTYTIKETLDKDDCIIISGHVTPLKLYMTVVHNPAKILVFDDVHSLMRDKKIVALLLQICDMGEDKQVSYYTTAKYHGEPVPTTTISNNKCILLCNNIPSGDATYDALLTRALRIKFNPSNEEVFKKLKTFAQDKKIIKWIQDNIEHFNEPINFRMYEWALKIKDNKQDWKALLTKKYKLNEEFKLIADLVNMKYSDATRIWHKRIGTSSRTFDRRKAEYLKTNK